MRTLVQSEKAYLLQKRGRLAPDHASVTVTFTLAFEKVAAANALSADLVRACAFLAPDAIPEEIFRDGAAALGEPLRGLADNQALGRAMADAARFSLIRRTAQTKTLTIHRLVQAILKAEMDWESQKLSRHAKSLTFDILLIIHFIIILGKLVKYTFG